MKDAIRKHLKQLLLEIGQERRLEAAEGLFSTLSTLLAPYTFILSFATFRSEIEMDRLNHELALSGRLLLPKIANDRLTIHHVQDLSKQTAPNRFGIPEPLPCCPQINPEQIDVILIPGLGFDQIHHRIGYGKGYYDRFLPLAKASRKIGIGFKEQLVERLPIEKTDYPLSETLLF